jgi:hypothetical protein
MGDIQMSFKTDKFTDTQILKGRDSLRGGQVDETKLYERIADMRASVAGTEGVSDKQIADAVLVAAAVANAASDDEWIAFVRTGELPGVIALRPSQLETARGGVIVFAIAVAMWYGGNALYEVCPWPNILA